MRLLPRLLLLDVPFLFLFPERFHDLFSLPLQPLFLLFVPSTLLDELGVVESEVLNLRAEESTLGRGRFMLNRDLGKLRLRSCQFLFPLR